MHNIFIFGHALAHWHSGGFSGDGQVTQKHIGGCGGLGDSMAVESTGVRRHGGQLHDGGLHSGQKHTTSFLLLKLALGDTGQLQ